MSDRNNERLPIILDQDVNHETDILGGHAPPLRDNPANKRFKTLVEFYFNEYSAADRRGKKKLADRILDIAADRGFRIMRKLNPGRQQRATPGGEVLWVEMGHTNAHNKVAHTSRSITKRIQRLRQQQQQGN
jgi:hypothetical protein